MCGKTLGRVALVLAVACLAMALLGCAPAAVPSGETAPCRLVLEQNPAFAADEYAAAVTPGQSVTFTLTPADGYTLTGCDYPGAQLTRTADGYTLTLPQVRYTTAVSVQAEQSGVAFYYHPNGGRLLSGNAGPAGWVALPVTPSHARLNTAQGSGLFERPGHTLTGWNTAADGSGTAVGLGSRAEPGARLYAQWAAWNAAKEFTYEAEPTGGAVVTGWHPAENTATDTLVIPAALGGLPVTTLAAGAFAGADCRAVVLPPSVRRVEETAFARCTLQSLTLFDSLQTISDYAFTGCENLQTLQINAATAPVYSGSYYATFADKYDHLVSLAEQADPPKKLVLFSGSSTRFGYDSAALDAALPGYAVANMGVFAYTNALPQLMLILQAMHPGDILLHTPEFDAARRQFCTTDKLEAPFFNMMEGNYDLVSKLDLRQFSATFAALNEYLAIRRTLPARSYGDSPADYDEDGNPAATPSYNAYGDYILPRPNATDDAPIYGLPVDYTVNAYPAAQFITPLNAVYRQFAAQGVSVYFGYAPRNRLAVSAQSNTAALTALDGYFRSSLTVPVLGTAEGSLLPGRYFYGTDNHLSTEGVALRTEQVIAQLSAQLAQEGKTP